MQIGYFRELNWQYREFIEAKGLWDPDRTDTGKPRPLRLRARGVTMVTPFYNSNPYEEIRFARKFDDMNRCEDRDQDSVEHIFVDDGSPSPLHKLLTIQRLKELKFNLTIYRIKQDVKWNTAGALNLGFSKAPTDWRICWDSDCSFTPKDMSLFMDLDCDPKYYYGISGVRFIKHRKPVWYYMTHGCFLVTKAQFEEIGGYDEDFVGAYSGGYAHFDNHFQWKLGCAGYPQLIPTGNAPQIIDDDRLTPERMSYTQDHLRINKKLARKKFSGEIPNNPVILRFDYEKTFEWHR